MAKPGRIIIKGPFPPPTGILDPHARTTASHVYQIFDGDGRKLMSGSFGPDTDRAIAYAKGLATGKGLTDCTLEIVAP